MASSTTTTTGVTKRKASSTTATAATTAAFIIYNGWAVLSQPKRWHKKYFLTLSSKHAYWRMDQKVPSSVLYKELFFLFFFVHLHTFRIMRVVALKGSLKKDLSGVEKWKNECIAVLDSKQTCSVFSLLPAFLPLGISAPHICKTGFSIGAWQYYFNK